MLDRKCITHYFSITYGKKKALRDVSSGRIYDQAHTEGGVFTMKHTAKAILGPKFTIKHMAFTIKHMAPRVLHRKF